MNVEQEQAVEALAELDPYTWWDNATHFNCGEAEAIADFLRAFSGESVADTFIQCHADDDDQGDQHYLCQCGRIHDMRAEEPAEDVCDEWAANGAWK